MTSQFCSSDKTWLHRCVLMRAVHFDTEFTQDIMKFINIWTKSVKSIQFNVGKTQENLAFISSNH